MSEQVQDQETAEQFFYSHGYYPTWYTGAHTLAYSYNYAGVRALPAATYAAVHALPAATTYSYSAYPYGAYPYAAYHPYAAFPLATVKKVEDVKA